MRSLTRRGFTIVELLMVLALVGILTGIAIPSFVTARRRARAAEVQQHLGELRVLINRLCGQGTVNCTEPDSSVFNAGPSKAAPSWLQDSIPARLAFDQSATKGYSLTWAPVRTAAGTDSRVIRTRSRTYNRRVFGGWCWEWGPWTVHDTIRVTRQTRGAYGRVAVVDEQPGRSALGTMIGQTGDMPMTFEPTTQAPNRWVLVLEPTAFRTVFISQDSTCRPGGLCARVWC
jgi:prepilin-type N-terminal cleavage/methylation domain-containing protein